MPEHPNLLFVWTDQQSADTLPQYGNDVVETPNLDALADRSTVFENPYVTKPLCSPSRSTVMTGRYSHSTGITHNNVPLAAHERCLPELGDFEEYATGWIGKWHLGDEVFAQHGFDEWVSTEDCYHPFYGEDRPQHAHSDYHDYLIEQGYEPDQREDDGFEWFSRPYVAETVPEEHSKPAFMARAAQRFLEAHRDEPFVLYVMFLEPHPPFTSPRDDQYDPGEVELPENFEHDNLDEQIDRVRLTRELIDRGLNGPTDIIGSPPTEAGWRELVSRYWGLVSLVDTHVGRILETVEDHGRDGETITVYTSDHGDLMGAHGLVRKMLQFEEVIKVPLFLRVPGTDRLGETVAQPVSQIDLVPTLLDAMGQPVPDRLQGYSWLPFLDREGPLEEENVFVEWNGYTDPAVDSVSNYGSPSNVPVAREEAAAVWAEMDGDRDLVEMVSDPIRTIVTPEGWKLNYRRSGEHELYDLTEDPGETENLATDDEYADLIEELYGEIVDWQLRTRDPVAL